MRRFISLHLRFPFFYTVGYFLFVLFLTLILAVKQYVGTTALSAGTPASSLVWAGAFIAAFGLATGIIMLVMRQTYRQILLIIIFYAALLQGIGTTLAVLAPFPSWLMATVGVLLVLWWSQRVWAHDAALALAIPGIALLLGRFLSPLAAILIVTVLSVYDYIAVSRTKLMKGMFEELAQQRVFFALIVPSSLAGLRAWLPEVSVRNNYLFLGTGDLALPAMLLVSVLRQGMLPALGVLYGTIAGFIALHMYFILRPKGTALPGLPPLIVGALLGYGLTFIL